MRMYAPALAAFALLAGCSAEPDQPTAPVQTKTATQAENKAPPIPGRPNLSDAQFAAKGPTKPVSPQQADLAILIACKMAERGAWEQKPSPEDYQAALKEAGNQSRIDECRAKLLPNSKAPR